MLLSRPLLWVGHALTNGNLKQKNWTGRGTRVIVMRCQRRCYQASVLGFGIGRRPDPMTLCRLRSKRIPSALAAMLGRVASAGKRISVRFWSTIAIPLINGSVRRISPPAFFPRALMTRSATTTNITTKLMTIIAMIILSAGIAALV